MDENWYDIPDTNGLYQVSNSGNIRSFRVWGQRYRVSETPRTLKQFDRGNGYFHVNIYRDGKMTLSPVHRIVLESIVGPCPSGYEACHNNNNPLDNRIENLRWDTRSSNFLDKRLNGTSRCGEDNNKAKFTEAQVISIRKRYAAGEKSQQALGTEFGVARNTIYRIIARITWKHI